MTTHKSFYISRRRFLKTSAAATALSTLPAWYQDELLAQDKPAQASSPNARPVIGLVGCGPMGTGDAGSASRFGDIAAICDLDESHLAEAKKKFAKAQTYSDFRKLLEQKDLDIILCGTVDHWHTLVSIAAMRAGKDVHCQKPLTLTIDEGKRLVKVTRDTKRILQTGSQQRSDPRFRLACELVRNNRIGKLKQVTTILPAGLHGGPFKPSPVPAGLNWDFWMGQTPKTDYVKERCHFSFRYWYDYSGGTMTDWGAHHNDIALWGMGMDRSGPISIQGKPLTEPVPGGYTAASQYHIEYAYANGVTHICKSTANDTPYGSVAEGKKEGEHHGVKFEGQNGWIFVTRGKIEASAPELLKEPLPANAERLDVSNDHMGNFIDCTRTRKPPVAEVEIGHRSVSVCHLGVLAMRLGRKLKWDPAKEVFVDDKEANTWLAREMRKPWDYSLVGG